MPSCLQFGETKSKQPPFSLLRLLTDQGSLPTLSATLRLAGAPARPKRLARARRVRVNMAARKPHSGTLNGKWFLPWKNYLLEYALY